MKRREVSFSDMSEYSNSISEEPLGELPVFNSRLVRRIGATFRSNARRNTSRAVRFMDDNLSLPTVSFIRSPRIAKPPCVEDSSHEAEWYCKTCAMDYCRSCYYTNHQASVALSTHRKIAMYEKKFRFSKCSQHPKLSAVFLCNCHENCLICTSCVSSGHSDHHFIPVGPLIEKKMDAIDTALWKIIGQQLSMSNFIETVELERKSYTVGRFNRFKTKIEMYYPEKKEEAGEKLKERYRSGRKQLAELKEKLEKAMEKTVNEEKILKNAVQSVPIVILSTSLADVTMVEEFRSSMNEMMNTLNRIPRRPTDVHEFCLNI